jgi:hypothetical protein
MPCTCWLCLCANSGSPFGHECDRLLRSGARAHRLFTDLVLTIMHRPRRAVAALMLAVSVALLLPAAVMGGTCTHLRDCSGHGTCDTVNQKCKCYNGWGSATDVALYKAPDCSMRE